VALKNLLLEWGRSPAWFIENPGKVGRQAPEAKNYRFADIRG